MKQIDEGEIIGRVLGGDREAFAVLVDAYKGPVFSLAFRMTGSTQDADDLTQESFLRAFQSLGRFRAGERFFPWLYTVSLNVIRNHLRKVKALPEEAAGKGMPDATDPRGDAADAAIGRERGRRLQGLPAEAARAGPGGPGPALLRGAGFEDIASVTGDTLSSAKMKVYRGLEKIRAMMEEDGFVDDETRS